MIDWLNSTALTLLDTPVSWAEVLGVVTGLVTVWFAARENILTWPVGLANSALFLVLFLEAKLYADSILQVFFIVLGLYGWWKWIFGRATDEAKLPVRRTTINEWIALAFIAATAQAALTYWLATHTDSPIPFWDASILVLSLVATYGQARKLLESWWVWITVVIISVPVYLIRDLKPTAVLYFVFGIMCVIGLLDWRRSYRTHTEHDTNTALVPAVEGAT
jgi:nicotinamide mononucleotide transporter